MVSQMILLDIYPNQIVELHEVRDNEKFPP
jgi:hypothetical protein